MSLLPNRSLRALALAACVWQAACEDIGTDPDSLRFGQLGEVRLNVSSPLLLGEGELQQSLTWNSTGPWQLTEEISYQGVTGDSVTIKSLTNPEALSGSYAVWITQVNDIQSLRLFVPELDPALNPECVGRTRVTLRIRDSARQEEAQWVRCVEGTLATLGTSDAGPDAAAPRVASAAQLLREYTLPAAFQSTFNLSYPFGTIVIGDTNATVDVPVVIDNQVTWETFWRAHAGAGATPQAIDFNKQLVVVAAIGRRPEVGESVEVRRVIPVDDGTLVQIVWRVPGNFCSPVSREHRPIHAVVIPRVPAPVKFGEIVREEVPCG